MVNMNDKTGYRIILENGLRYLSNDEYMKLHEYLSKNDIQLTSFDNPGPKASLNDISIYICNNITELLIAGVLMPAMYDVIKKTLILIINKIREKVKILQSDRIREAIPCLTFKTRNGEIKVPIPTNISIDQLENYLDEVKKVMKHIKINPNIKYECFIIERNDKSLKMELKTLQQYYQGQNQKQKKKK